MKRAAWSLFAAALILGAADSDTIEHVVGPGDSLWSIAAQPDVYDDPYLWPVIYKFNRDQIVDPALIYPEQRLVIPVRIDEETRRAARLEAGVSADPSASQARSSP